MENKAASEYFSTFEKLDYILKTGKVEELKEEIILLLTCEPPTKETLVDLEPHFYDVIEFIVENFSKEILNLN